MKSKILLSVFVFLSLFVLIVSLSASVSASCQITSVDGDGNVLQKTYSLDPSSIKEWYVEIEPNYRKLTKDTRGFEPTYPPSPLDTMSIVFKSDNFRLTDCLSGFDDNFTMDPNTGEYINNPVYNPIRYGSHPYVGWRVIIRDKITGEVFLDMPTSPSYNGGVKFSDYKENYLGMIYPEYARLDGRININLDVMERYQSTIHHDSWPYRVMGSLSNPDLNDTELFDNFVKAIDRNNLEIELSSTFVNSIDPFNPVSEGDNEGMKVNRPFSPTNCVHSYGNGPIKVVTGFQKTNNAGAINGLSTYDFASIVDRDFITNSFINPYYQYQGNYSTYYYLGDYNEMKKGKCSGASGYIVFQNEKFDTEEKVKGDSIFISLFGLGFQDPYIYSKFVHGFSHIFANLNDENVEGPAALKEKGNNCISRENMDKWYFWSNYYPGCGGNRNLLRSSELSMMYLDLLNYTELGNEYFTYVPKTNEFNIVSCAHILASIKRTNYTDNVKECYYSMNAYIRPRYPGMPVMFPDRSSAEDN